MIRGKEFFNFFDFYWLSHMTSGQGRPISARYFQRGYSNSAAVRFHQHQKILISQKTKKSNHVTLTSPLVNLCYKTIFRNFKFFRIGLEIFDAHAHLPSFPYHSSNSQSSYQWIRVVTIFHKSIYCHNSHIGLIRVRH